MVLGADRARLRPCPEKTQGNVAPRSRSRSSHVLAHANTRRTLGEAVVRLDRWCTHRTRAKPTDERPGEALPIGPVRGEVGVCSFRLRVHLPGEDTDAMSGARSRRRCTISAALARARRQAAAVGAPEHRGVGPPPRAAGRSARAASITLASAAAEPCPLPSFASVRRRIG